MWNISPEFPAPIIKNLLDNGAKIDKMRADRCGEWDPVLSTSLEPLHLAEPKDNLSLKFFILWNEKCPTLFGGGWGEIWFMLGLLPSQLRVLNPRVMGSHGMNSNQGKDMIRFENFEEWVFIISSWTPLKSFPFHSPKVIKKKNQSGDWLYLYLYPMLVVRPNVTVIRGSSLGTMWMTIVYTSFYLLFFSV